MNIEISPTMWRTIALGHVTRDRHVKIMEERYGLKRITPMRADEPFRYEVLDEQKYLLFVLTYL